MLYTNYMTVQGAGNGALVMSHDSSGWWRNFL